MNGNCHLCLRLTGTAEGGEQCSIGGERKRIDVLLNLHVVPVPNMHDGQYLKVVKKGKKVSLPLMG